MAMEVRLLAIILLLAPVIWNIYTTRQGLCDFFDLPTHPSINPGQFVFGIVVTIIVIGFVVASRAIWSARDEAPFALLKAASVVCIAIDAAASWFGTKHVISFDYEDPAKAVGLALMVALLVLSKIALSMLLFDTKSGG
jgi:tryptophan-rich sensory protein